MWGFAALLGTLSLTCIVPNYLLVWQEIRAKPGERVPSLIPIVGGVLGYFAIRLLPQPGWSAYAWVAPVLDPGCYLIYFLVMPIVWKLRGYSRN